MAEPAIKFPVRSRLTISGVKRIHGFAMASRLADVSMSFTFRVPLSKVLYLNCGLACMCGQLYRLKHQSHAGYDELLAAPADSLLSLSFASTRSNSICRIS